MPRQPLATVYSRTLRSRHGSRRRSRNNGRDSTPSSSCTAFVKLKPHWLNWLTRGGRSVPTMRGLNSSWRGSQNCGAQARFARPMPSIQQNRVPGAPGKTPSKGCGRKSCSGYSTTPTPQQEPCSNASEPTIPVGSLTGNFERCNAASRNGVRSWRANCSTPAWAKTKLKPSMRIPNAKDDERSRTRRALSG